jgi:Radical SAM superfamily/4Fe-4S single cluster domain
VKKHLFSKIEFYITNVCNLTCEGCNRFNNYNFAGWQRWSDYKADYEEWAKYVDIDRIVILGGEPLLNPDILDWVYGINQVFKRNVQILSNGTRLNKVKGLYEALQANGNWMGISWHNPNTIYEFEQEVHKFLQGTVIRVEKDDPKNEFGADVVWIDENKVAIPLWIQWDFYDSAIQRNELGQFTLHNSRPEVAHNSCGFRIHKNYHFIKGKLYKCGPSALFPEFDQQHPFGISEEDRRILHSYQPLSPYEFLERGQEFLANIDKQLDQCKFCPESLEYKNRLFAVSKNQAKKQYTLEPI